MTDHPKNSGGVDYTIDPLVQKPARWVVQFYWAFVSMSVYFYFSKVEPQPIDVSFFPLILTTGFLVKSFLWTEIPSAFRRLVQLGSLNEDRLPQILAKFQHSLDNWKGTTGFGILGAFPVVWFYYSNDGGVGLFQDIRYLLIVLIDVLYGYTIGVVSWKAVSTALNIIRIANDQELALHPFHPDNCQGLSPIGHLCLYISVNLVAFGVFFAGWIIHYRWPGHVVTTAYEHYEPVFIVGLFIVAVLSNIAFFLPMISVHRVMEDAARLANTQIGNLGVKISHAHESLLSQGFELTDDKLKSEDTKLSTLRNLYLQRSRVRTWPIDFWTYVKFLSAQFALWLGIVTSMVNLWDKVINK